MVERGLRRIPIVLFTKHLHSLFELFFLRYIFASGILLRNISEMEVNPMVALRALLVGGVAAFAKVGAAMKAAGGAKIGAAATAMTVAATTAMSGSKQEPQDDSKHLPR